MRRKEQPLVTKLLNNTPRYPRGAMVNQIRASLDAGWGSTLASSVTTDFIEALCALVYCLIQN